MPHPAKKSRKRNAGLQITIDPGDYNGYYRLGFESEFVGGIQTIDVQPGTQTFDIGTSQFMFDVSVDTNGNAMIVKDSISMSDAAEVSPNSPGTLQLKTLPVVVHPNHYGGPLDSDFVRGFYFLNIYETLNYPGSGLEGKQTFQLIPGMLYWIDNGSFAGNSLLSFRIGKRGKTATITGITPPSAATAIANQLRFEVAPIEFKPGAYIGDYFVSAIRFKEGTQGANRFNLIKGLTASIDTGASIADSKTSSYFYFTVVEDGSVTVEDKHRDAAKGRNNAISFTPVPVTVTPSDLKATYRIDTQRSVDLKGQQTLQLLPNLIYWIEVNGSVAYFTPQPGSPSTTLTVDKVTFTIRA